MGVTGSGRMLDMLDTLGHSRVGARQLERPKEMVGILRPMMAATLDWSLSFNCRGRAEHPHFQVVTLADESVPGTFWTC